MLRCFRQKRLVNLEDLQKIDYIYDHEGEPTIPSRKGAKFERLCDWWLYKERHLVKKYFLKLKGFRHIATHYDKLAFTYLGFICLASILIWLKKPNGCNYQTHSSIFNRVQEEKKKRSNVIKNEDENIRKEKKYSLKKK